MKLLIAACALSFCFGAGGAAAQTAAKGRAPARPAAVAKPSGNAVIGAAAFATRCAVCHGKEGVGTAIGPSLGGVYGAKAGAGGSTLTSPAMKAYGMPWTEANLDAYLAGPGKVVPGGKMLIAVPGAADRKNIIAYVATLKK